MDDWNDFGYDDSRTPRASDANNPPPRPPSTTAALDSPSISLSHPRSISALPTPSFTATATTTATSATAFTDDTTRVYELADSYSSFSSSAGAGSVTGAEPRSIMMPIVSKARAVPPSASRPDPNPNSAHAKGYDNPNHSSGSSGDGNEKNDKMDLDDMEEWGSSRSYNSRINSSSSSDRYHKRSYTKLEVFSGQQIQQLLNCFHLIVTLAVCWTLFSIIIGNAKFADTQPQQVVQSLLSEQQLRDAIKQNQDRLNENISPGATITARFSSKMHLQSTSRSSSTLDLKNFNPWKYEPPKSRNCFLCYMQRLGSCSNWNEWLKCDPGNLPMCECCDQPTLRLPPNMKRSTQPIPELPYLLRWVPFSLENCHLADVKKNINIHGAARQINFAPQTGDGATIRIPLRYEIPDRFYANIIHVVNIVGGLILLVLGTLLVIRLVRTGRRNVSQEQMFACALLFGSFLYFSVPLSFYSIYTDFAKIFPKGFFPDVFNLIQDPLMAMRLFFTPFLFFFLWANIHSYRILDPTKKLGARFYLLKIALLLPILAIKLSAFHFIKMRTAMFPFTSIIFMQHSFGRYNFRRAYPKHLYFLIALTLCEAFMVGYSIWQAVLTTRALRKVPYMRHRSKHTGFRFFMYINLVFFLTYFLLEVLLIIGKPAGGPLLAMGLNQPVRFAVGHSHEVGTMLLLFGYIVIWAYVNLPYDSVGAVKGWFKGSELPPSTVRWSSFSGKDLSNSGNEKVISTSCGLDSDTASGTESASYSQGYGYGTSGRSKRPGSDSTPIFKIDRDYELEQEIAEPITYRKRESDKSVELKANCFTMQTHVILFNFAWYVYYYGTPKFEAINQDDQILPFQFDISESIREESTDTQALVINSDDRIIVTFKGSTSLRNLKTSLAAFHEKLRNVVPTNIDNSSELVRIQEIFGRVYDSAKIHKGFAMAYASVAHRVMSAIKRLHAAKPRPVFLTGHSLGGALATICSLDVWVKLRISRRQIFVSTFGSPRVGNDAFKKIYDSVIALHWRIVVDPDMVAKLPKGMYRHVGKKVMLTQHGDLFIDPSVLEMKLWSGSTAGFAYHRKASYLLAMEAWCLRHHKLSYVPKFWEFPVRDEDRQRFQGAIADPEASMHINMDDSMAPRSRLIKKIILLDAMVDSLDDGTGRPQNQEAVEKWARLTRRLLLRAKLAATVTGSGNAINR